MIRTYLVLAYRNLRANKLVSAINILGLSIATACVIAVFLFLQNYWTLDNFHVNGDRIYMVEYQVENEQTLQTWGNAPEQIARALKADFPQVERAVRVENQGISVTMNGTLFEELITYADTGFLQMFTFPLAIGNPGALADPDAVILSSAMAEKYFGREMPLGRQITVTDQNQQKKQFTVQGVARPFPQNAGFLFSFLAGIQDGVPADGSNLWTKHATGVFIQVRQPEDIRALERGMDRYVGLYNAVNPLNPVKSFLFDNLRHPAPDAYQVYNRPAEAAQPLLALVFSLIALLMMALSCFNYINISLGSITQRLKEIGIRKVMGGGRKQLIAQFLTENLVLCFGALLLGLVLTDLLLVPLFNHTMVMQVSLSFSDNSGLWFFLVGLLVFTGLASGAYPAFYISSFKPTVIFSGKQKFGGKNVLSRLFLTLQFVLAFMSVIVTVVLAFTGSQWANMDWGYNPGNTLVVPLNENGRYGLLRDEALKSPHITGVAGAFHHIGHFQSRETALIADKKQEVVRYDVGPGYFQALGLGLKAGRFFDENLDNGETSDAAVVNETFVAGQGWSDPVGQTLRVGGKPYLVAGVVKDFKFFGSGAKQPIVFLPSAENDYGYLVARFEPETGEKVASDIQSSWSRLFKDAPFDYFFQSDVFEGFNRSYTNVAKSIGYLAGLALLIACMGLYGLAAQHYTRNVKEMGVRKVLGASVSQIILLVNKNFLLMLLISGSIASGVSFIGIQLVFRNFEQYTGELELGVMPFVLANIIVLVTGAIAVGRQTYQMTTVQLSDVLREE